ncbi:MAG: MFS transporter [Candidatus Methanofastidiosia archaeon]|jgi:MFS family permease
MSTYVAAHSSTPGNTPQDKVIPLKITPKLESYQKILSPAIIGIGLAHFITHVLEFALPPLFPLLIEEFQFSYSKVGILSSVVILTMFIFQTPLGHLSDKKGRKVLLVSFSMILVAGTFLTGFSQVFIHLLIFQVVVGVGASAYHSAGMALASDIAPKKRIGRFMAIQGFGGTLGVATAPFIVTIFATALGWRTALQSTALVITPIVVLIWWLLKTSDNTNPAQEKDTVVLPKIVIVFILLGFLLQGFVFRGIISFFPTYLVDIHGSTLKLAGALTSLLFLGGAFAEFAGGEWADRTEKLNIVVISYGMRCLLLYLITTVYHETALIALVVTFGFIQGLSIPALVSLIRDMSPPDSAGRSYGAVFSSTTLTGFFSPLIVGYIADIYDLHVSFHILTIALLIAFLCSVLARYFKHAKTSYTGS